MALHVSSRINSRKLEPAVNGAGVCPIVAITMASRPQYGLVVFPMRIDLPRQNGQRGLLAEDRHEVHRYRGRFRGWCGRTVPGHPEALGRSSHRRRRGARPRGAERRPEDGLDTSASGPSDPGSCDRRRARLDALRQAGRGAEGIHQARAPCARRSDHTPTRLQGCLWPYVGWIGVKPTAPCSRLNDCHPRPVNAYF